MAEYLLELAKDVASYIYKAWNTVEPILALILTTISYIMFPDSNFVTAGMAIAIAVFLDWITKYYALSKQHGGFRNALIKKYINSNTLWKGTSRKIVSYFIVMILGGLSVRIAPTYDPAVFVVKFFYFLIFLRETQSILENLIDAGFKDLNIFLAFLRRKEKELIDEINKNEEVK